MKITTGLVLVACVSLLCTAIVGFTTPIATVQMTDRYKLVYESGRKAAIAGASSEANPHMGGWKPNRRAVIEWLNGWCAGKEEKNNADSKEANENKKAEDN